MGSIKGEIGVRREGASNTWPFRTDARRDESRFLVMDEREKSGSYISDSIFDLKIGSRIYFFLARERERKSIPQMTPRWNFGHERRRREREKKGKVQIHNYYGVASERYCMVRYSDGASPRRWQHPCTWKVFNFNRPHVFYGVLFTHMNENFTRIY